MFLKSWFVFFEYITRSFMRLYNCVIMMTSKTSEITGNNETGRKSNLSDFLLTWKDGMLDEGIDEFCQR